MNEAARIIAAFDKARQQGIRCALATVVKTEGSSYRRAGARMLVDENGKLTGAISGGCLEGDALRKARLAISEQKNKLIIYDTTDEDDIKLGVQLGCNGIVHILFEPLAVNEDDRHPIRLLRLLNNQRKPVVVGILFSENPEHNFGSCLLMKAGEYLFKGPEKLNKILRREGEQTLHQAMSAEQHITYKESTLHLFTEYIPAPVHLVIAGAGNDAQPLTAFAAIAGWKITVADGRSSHATAERFPQADRIIITKPENILNDVIVDEQTVFVLMTHNYNYDLAVLKKLICTDCCYIGILGPKKKYERMLADLEAEGIFLSEKQLHAIHAPVGLDIGAETPEEIALSVTAEIKAAMSCRSGLPLKEKTAPIHASIKT